MLQSLKNITKDIKLKEKELSGRPVGSSEVDRRPSVSGVLELFNELNKIDERLEQDLIYYRKTIIDILDDVNSIKFLNLNQERSLHKVATQLNVLFDEITASQDS